MIPKYFEVLTDALSLLPSLHSVSVKKPGQFSFTVSNFLRKTKHIPLDHNAPNLDFMWCLIYF